MLIRFDRGPLQRPQRRGDAFVVEGYAARTHKPGDPLRYAHGDEYRDAGELARIASQMKGLPVTLPHPPGLLRNGVKGRIVGRVDDAWVDGDKLGVRLTVTDRNAASEVEAGTKELSLGYATRVDEAGYQRDSEADHLAIVQAARCGSTCSLRTDEADVIELPACCDACAAHAQIDRNNKSGELGDTMKTLEEAKARIDELGGENTTLKTRITELEALVASGAQAAESEAVKKATERADAAEQKVARFDETFTTAVQARAKLEREAAAVLGAQVRLDGLTDRQIHELAVKRLDASADVAAANDAELRGRYNTLIGLSARNAESQARIAEILGGQKPTPAPRADEESYESLMRNSWKQNRRAAAGGQ